MKNNNWYTIIEKKPYIPGLIIIGFILIIYIPSLDIYLMRDDFEWLNESYGAWQNPSVLFHTINSFFRPLVKLSYLLNYIFFKTDVPFYNLTTILFHLVNVSLLYVFLYRVTKKIHIAALSSLAYGTSPFYSEVTLWAAGRPDSILLVFMMAVMICFIDVNEKEKIPLKKYILIIFLTLCAAGSKESWITLPFLVFSFLPVVKQISLKAALKKTSVLFLLLGLYAGYFIIIPLFSGTAAPTLYNKLDIGAMIKKFGFLVFKYTGMGETFTGAAWQFIIIILCLGALTYRFLQSKNFLALWGLIWLLITMGISLFIFYPPSRYNYLPLLGFWVMVTAFLSQELKNLMTKFNIDRRLVFTGTVVIFGLILNHQAAMLQLEINDYRSQGAAHKQVADMYVIIKDHLPRHQPIIFVDISTRKAVDEAVQSVKGYRKVLFVRSKAIWQLVFLPPLANFLGSPFKERMEPIPENEWAAVFQGEYTVLVFTGTSFFISDSYKKDVKEYYQKSRQLPNKVQAVRFIEPESKRREKI